MSKRIQVGFFIALFLSSFFLQGQKRVQTVSYFQEEIKAGSFSKESYGYKLFSWLALNNIKGLKWTFIDFTGTIIIQTEESKDGHLFAYTKLVKYTINGENHFRDFNIDSLLVPSAISGTLKFTDDYSVLIEQPVELLLTGGLVDLDGLGLSVDSISNLKVRIEIDQFVYSKDQWEAFHRASRLMNLYYAYNEVLKNVLNEYARKGINKKQNSSHVFVAWHEISRINQLIENRHFSEKLNLEENDPINFLNTFAKSKRLERRANTLFNLVLDSKAQSSISEKDNYCKLFTGLSKKYSAYSKQYQPYIASGFYEVVRVFPNKKEFRRIEQVTAYYDVFNKLDLPATPQCIYDNYIDLAIQSYDENEFVLTLDLLYNATTISDQFENVGKTRLHNQVYANTLDGLMSAYLSVAIRAYRSGSFEKADIYYQKALNIFQLHKQNLSGESLSSDSFLNFIEQQVELANTFMDDGKYWDGIRLADQAKNISKTHSGEQNSLLFDSVYSKAYLGIYEQKLDSIGELIATVKIEKAMLALDEANSFSNEKENYLNGDLSGNLSNHAKSLFEIYYSKGERLMKSRNSEQALFAFLKAQEINNKYLHEDQPFLDSLIYEATIPVILDLTKKATFETWANRMEDANNLYHEALALQRKYNQMDNQEINIALLTLNEKMDNRVCVNLGNKIFELQNIVENRLKHKDFLRAGQLADSAFKLISSHPDCEADASEFITINKKYKDAFAYAKIIESANQLFAEGKYTQSAEQFMQLLKLYLEKNISRYQIAEPNPEKFTIEKNSPNLTKAMAAYLVNENQFTQAYGFLVLLKNQNVLSKDIRQLQESIGFGLANEDNLHKEAKTEKVKQYTKGDKWFRYFKSAYLKN